MAECEHVCEHIHFPLQSGSDRVLRAMQRSYRRERYLEWLARIRSAIPGIAVSTDIIVGFPGETERDFEDTLDVVRAGAVRQRATCSSTRPGPGHERRRWRTESRRKSCRSVSTDSSSCRSRHLLEKNRAQLGRTFEVLVEGEGKREGSDPGANPDQPDRAPGRPRSTEAPSSTRA